MSNQLWLIWSIEHNAWWRSHSQGYTPQRQHAGRYEWTEALEIVRSSNIRCGNVPNESLVPDE